MKIFLIIGLLLGVIATIAIKVKSKYRFQITIVYFVSLILLNTVLNIYGIDNIQKFINPTNQLVYQPEYIENGEYPEALINLLIDGKTVYMKDDQSDLYQVTLTEFMWLYPYYHYHNPSLYFEHYRSRVIHDDSLNNSVIKANEKEDFEDIGFANDMLRNVCLYHQDDTGAADYFYHYAYYRVYVNAMHIYVNFDGITDTDELVLLWQLQNPDDSTDETEDLYLMTKSYYDNNKDKIVTQQ